jgi:hypothetical protein
MVSRSMTRLSRNIRAPRVVLQDTKYSVAASQSAYATRSSVTPFFSFNLLEKLSFPNTPVGESVLAKFIGA